MSNLPERKEGLEITNDERFIKGLKLFNSADWYKAHDLFEDLWHETYGPERSTIQGILQIAVAQVHLESGNTNGAKILYGEGLGRLKGSGIPDLGLNIEGLCKIVELRLNVLHQDIDLTNYELPFLTGKL
ncbi:DUF309 domain-containing protein [Prochlorococcus sp. MIT 1223]|uniref:DUF309 domain-containing protein n=1 Tax=Prochlorococcus sp. MIT 1223 TaxID=3096217 RepID=UPI002A758166|nr:DUF309 domain-containing protein [Prochlorococcus sp. MIT 1223]